jgi:hypothetical protein
VGTATLQDSPKQVKEYFHSMAQSEFKTKEERLSLNGPVPLSHALETDIVPEDVLNSFMDDFEATSMPNPISQSRKLEQQSTSMIDRFLQLRGRAMPVGIISSLLLDISTGAISDMFTDIPESGTAKRQKLDVPVKVDESKRNTVSPRGPVTFELPIPDFDYERASRHTYFAASRILCHGSLIRLLENNFAVDLIERVIDTAEVFNPSDILKTIVLPALGER